MFTGKLKNGIKVLSKSVDFISFFFFFFFSISRGFITKQATKQF